MFILDQPLGKRSLKESACKTNKEGSPITAGLLSSELVFIQQNIIRSCSLSLLQISWG